MTCSSAAVADGAFASPLAGARSGFGTSLRRAGKTVARWHRRRQTRRALAELSPHLLRDIGVTLAEASVEANKPFWRA